LSVIFMTIPNFCRAIMAEQIYSNAAMLANTLADVDNKLPRGTSECFNFGSCWGCRPSCPVFQRGECEIEKEVVEQFKESGEYDYELEELGLL